MHVLVTGGAGFLGSHLVRRLLDADHEVTVIDNLSTGSRDNLPVSSKKLIMLWSDITNPHVSPMDLILGGKPDLIYHLACPASPKAYQEAPLETLTTSFMGTWNVLSFANRTGARVLFTSTSEIYGDPAISPQPETYWGNVNTWGPRACYDEGKRVAETLCYECIRKGIDVRVVRIFNTYGPNMAKDDGRVISNFINQALRSEPLTVYGDGLQTRSFCYVDDLIEGLFTVMRQPKAVFTPPINIGNPTEFTMLNLAQRVIELSGSTSPIRYQPLPVDDPKQRCPDISRIKELGWEPKISLEDGLTRTIDYFRSKM